MNTNEKNKVCPYCAEEIGEVSAQCPYCQSCLDNSAGMNAISGTEAGHVDKQEISWYRCKEGKWLGGICMGLSQHFQLPVLALRLAFVIATIFGGWGIFIYLYLWLLMPVKKK